MFTPLVRGTHTGGKKKKNYIYPMGASLQLHTKATFLQNILGEPRGKGEVYDKQTKGPRWNIARMNVLNKKAFL